MKIISFIMPIYNTKISNLKKSINSIINQKIDDYEIILIDDGSNDESIKEVCNKYVSIYKNIKYIYQENSGSAVARNKGLSIATGKYICFVDSDDELTADYYQNIHSIIDEKHDIFIFDYSNVYKNSENIHTLSDIRNIKDYKNDILSNIMLYPNKMNNFMLGSIWGKLFLNDYLKTNNIKFVKELRKAQDRMFMLTAIDITNDIVYYPIYSYKYISNGDSITHKLNYNMIKYYSELQSSVLGYCHKHSIDSNCYKFFTYQMINELLLLSLFHLENDKKYSIIKKEYIDLTMKFNLTDELKRIKYSDMSSIKERIKLFLFKHNMIYLLRKYFLMIQIKHKRKNV